MGKTSLVSFASMIVDDTAVRINCDTSDTFGTLWQKVCERVTVTLSRPGVGFAAKEKEVVIAAAEALPKHPGPADIEAVLSTMPTGKALAIFIDEFDRVRDPEAPVLLADTIKTLSDQGVPATVIVVGVADNVSDLIAEHASIERALVQVRMPRMSPEELDEIVTRGLDRVDMTIAGGARDRICALSQGLPHYVHLLAQEAAKEAAWNKSEHITFEDVLEAMKKAIDRAEHTLAKGYHAATQSPRAVTLYPAVLLAAALAPGDDLGYFAPADIRDPLRAITKKQYDIPAFSPHLHELCEPARGQILQKVGQPRRFRFRFRNPLHQPYVIMRALAEQDLAPEIFDHFLGGRTARKRS